MQADTQDRLAPRRGLAWTARYDPDTSMPMHCDGRSRLSLVLAARVREMAGGEEASADAFGVALKKADALHAIRFGPEGGRVASIDLEAFAAARVRSAQEFVRLRCDAGPHSGTFCQEKP